MTEVLDRSGLRPKIIASGDILLLVKVGSHAHGTAREDSDIDFRCVYAVPTQEILRPRTKKLSTSLWIEDTTHKIDITGWEVGHFCNMALQCNPTILEVLWASADEITELGKELQALAPAFLNRRRVYDAFSGYALNQRKKMLDEPAFGWTIRNIKYAQAYIRVLHQGTVLAKTGKLPVKLEDENILKLLELLTENKMNVGDVIKTTRQMTQELLSAVESSIVLPEKADFDKITQWLLSVRKEYWKEDYKQKKEEEGTEE